MTGSVLEIEDVAKIVKKEAWENFLISNKKCGLIHRVTAVENDMFQTDLLTAFNLGEKSILMKHSVAYNLTADGISWNSYEFRQGNDVTLAKVVGEEIHYSINSKKHVITLPENALCSYLYHAILGSMALEEGDRYEFTELTDSDPSQQNSVRYKCIGAEEIMVGNNPTPIWIYGQKTGSKKGNTYWLDAEHNIVKSDWSGASSVLVGSANDAFQHLPPKLLTSVEKFLG